MGRILGKNLHTITSRYDHHDIGTCCVVVSDERDGGHKYSHKCNVLDFYLRVSINDDSKNNFWSTCNRKEKIK